MAIINIIDESNKSQTIQQNLEDTKQIEYIIKDGYLNKIRVLNGSSDILSEIALNNGKIDYFVSYLDKELFISESKVAGFTIKPNNDNILSLYKNYRSEAYYSQHEISIPDHLMNNKSTQYIIERDGFGNKVFEGSGLNKLKHGKGISYHHDNQKKYEGFFVKDYYHGFGIEYHYNGNKYYEGQWDEGKPEGKVDLYHSNGDLDYCGMMSSGQKNGYGVKYDFENSIGYEGFWKNDQHDGLGKLYQYPGMLLMEGKFSHNSFEGIRYYPNIGTKFYEGTMIFQNNDWVLEGKGKKYFPNGNLEFDGVYIKGECDHGSFYHKNGTMYYKGFLTQYEQMNHGYGETYDLCGELCSKGQWNMGELESIEIPEEYKDFGFVTYKAHERDGGQIYLGEISNGEPNGYGMHIDIYSGIIREEGYWRNSTWHGLFKWFYYEDGHKYLKKIGHYDQCETVNRESYYHQNGKLQFLRPDLHGLNDKFGVFYHKNGKIDLSRSYKELKKNKNFE